MKRFNSLPACICIILFLTFSLSAPLLALKNSEALNGIKICPTLPAKSGSMRRLLSELMIIKMTEFLI